MNTKKEIRNIIAEHSADSASGRIKSRIYTRDIYLTDKDYVQVEIVESFINSIIIRLHVYNRQYSIFCAEGLIDELDGVWRRFRYRFKQRIAEEEEKSCWDAEFVAKLKEIYSLL